MNHEKNGNKHVFIAFDYKELQVDSSKLSMYLDGYRSFGWLLDSQSPMDRRNEKLIIRLKRERKILNKAELTRLQRNFEDCLLKIKALEQSKTTLATSISILIGIIGTGFMAGSVFAVTANPPIIWLTIVLSIPAVLGWIAPYFCFKEIVKKRTAEVQPLIEEKYDEIYELCEQGIQLLCD